MTKADTIRDTLRGTIFSHKKFKSEQLELFGAIVELRQPSLGDILAFQNEDDSKQGLINLLVGYCYVPGTNEKVFELGDADAILSMPFNDDIIRLNQVVENLTGLDVAAEEGN